MRPFLSQAEQWPDRCAATGQDHTPPSASELAAEDWERERQRKYPRGSGPPLHGEDDPHDMDPEGASLDDHDPDRFLDDPGFIEEEVDDWPDPDIGHAPYHEGDRVQMANQLHPDEPWLGTVMGHFAEGEPHHTVKVRWDKNIFDPVDPDTGPSSNWHHVSELEPGPHPFGTPTYTPGGGIPHEDYDPHSLDNLPPDEPGGEDIHHFGAARFYDHPEPERAIRNDEVTIMHVPEEEGPGYDAIVRKSPDGKGWDVLRPLN